MKNRIHTTKGGDKFLRTHILDATPWSDESYQPAHPLPGERVSIAFGIFTGVLAVAVTVAIILAK